MRFIIYFRFMFKSIHEICNRIIRIKCVFFFKGANVTIGTKTVGTIYVQRDHSLYCGQNKRPPSTTHIS